MTQPTDTGATAVTEPVPDAGTVEGPTTGQKIAAEAIGTFVLVLFGCGSAVYAANGGDFDILAVALAFGLAVAVMAYAFGRISGGHFNPAVSVGAALGGRIAWRDAGIYVGAQLVGAILGGAVLFALLHGFDGFDATDNMGQNFFGDGGYAVWAALLLELLLTAIFVLVILAVTDGRNEHPGLAPLTIGLTLVGIHLVAIPATGTSVNPARSIGPALFAGTDAILDLWLFILAPLLGAAIAGLAYPALFGHASDPVPGSGFTLPRRSAAPGATQDQYQQQWNQQQGQYAQSSHQQSAHQQGWGQQGTGAQQWGPEPIIQDGWQWDPHAQQWIPAQQPYAQGGQAGQTGQAQGGQAQGGQAQGGQAQAGPATGEHQAPYAPEQQGQWPDDGQTQIRPGR